MPGPAFSSTDNPGYKGGAPAYSRTPVEDRPLTPQQMRFVEEYIQDSSSAKAAALRAGYSIHTATTIASNLMADPRVKKLVQEANSQAAKSLGISAERVLQELWKVAGANPGDTVQLTEDGPDIDARSAGEVMVTTVSGNGKKVKSVTAKTIKPSDKIAALEKIAKIMNLYPKEEPTEIKLSLSELIERSMTSEPRDLKDTVAEIPEA